MLHYSFKVCNLLSRCSLLISLCLALYFIWPRIVPFGSVGPIRGLSLVLIWFFSLSMGRGNWVTYGVELVVANKPDGALFARLPSSWKKKIQIFRTYSSSGALRNCYSSNVGLQSDTNVIKLDFSF